MQTDSAKMGDIICFSGVVDITIGDTVTAVDAVEPLPFVKVSEPTIEMTFAVNDSPFAGREGKFVTSRQLRERLFRELLKDVSLRVTETDSTDAFRVAGRGEMHLSILIENMRREGYELSVSTPRVLFKKDEATGKKLEPIERLVIDVPEDCVGSVMEKIGARKGEMLDMHPQGSRMRIEFLIPARGLFGYKSEFLTDTKGEGIMSQYLTAISLTRAILSAEAQVHSFHSRQARLLPTAFTMLRSAVSFSSQQALPFMRE